MGDVQYISTDRCVEIRLSGNWCSSEAHSGKEDVQKVLASARAPLMLEAYGDKITGWDGTLVSWLFKVHAIAAKSGGTLNLRAFPSGITKLLNLAVAVPERKGARREETKEPLLESIGRLSMANIKALNEALSFLGELTLALGRYLRKKARVPSTDIWRTIEQCGPGALPIVTLISILVGLILAFIGAQQLRQFGAHVYVADLVGIAMVREMGAVMAGVIMAGRTGAAFAAQLGTMQVNEEIDALKTFGFSPIEFLVIPRVLALVLMMPLLCLYADIMGILGSAVVSTTVLDLSFTQYFVQTQGAVTLGDIWIGLIKSAVFGALIALAGCHRGMTCDRSASAVGSAVTSAVVSGIVAIVVCDAIFAVLCEIIGI